MTTITLTTPAIDAAVPAAAFEHGAVRLIPLDKLKKSPRNARKTPHSEAAIEALAASLAHKGMLQMPVVEPEYADDGEATGFFLVTVGEGRRLAQRLRAKRKQIRKTQPIACVLDLTNDPQEISLDENVTRSANHPFEQPQKLSPFEALKEAEGYAEEWLRSADRFKLAAEFLMQNEGPKEAAFQLHQATERLYHGLLLVLTLYSPKSHRLNFLRSQCEQADERLKAAWPRSTRFEQRCFELLRRAYVDARYSPHYKISDEELSWLVDRVGVLQALVQESVASRLQAMRSGLE